MHIAIVTETYPPEVNGVAMTLSRLANGLVERGNYVSIVRPRQQVYDRPGCCTPPEITLVAGLPVPGYRGIHIGLPAWGRLQRLWHKDKPDVIYIATEGPLGWSALRIARKFGIPVLSGFHTNFQNYARHYGATALRHVILAYLKYFHNRTAGTMVPNQKLADTLTTAGFENVSILARGVDSRLFSPQRRCQQLRRAWGAHATDPVILYVGRVAAEKNIQLAIESFYRARQEHRNLRMVIVGDGPLYTPLQRDNPSVIFCGIHTGKELAKYYASADIFAFPSETETFGNVTLEAMASGLQVIAYDYAAAAMHIQHGSSGLLVPLGNSEAFKTTLCEAVKFAEARQQMRGKAREYAMTIDWPTIVETFETHLIASVPPIGGFEEVSDDTCVEGGK